MRAVRHVVDRDPRAREALLAVMRDHPVLASRAPALHKFSVMGFEPVLSAGKTIRLNPAVNPGFNADNDGDSCICSVFTVDALERGGRAGSRSAGKHVAGLADVVAAHAVHISKFPRVEETARVTRGGNTVYDVPPDVKTIAVKADGTFVVANVTKFSVHPNCREWVVRTGCGRRLVVSQDHSLAIVNPDTLEVVRAAPATAVGKCIPALRQEVIALFSVRGRATQRRRPRRDVVPLPLAVRMEFLRRAEVAGSAKAGAALRTAKTVVARKVADRLLALCADSDSGLVRRWADMVRNPQLSFDEVVSAKPTGKTKVMYDLTVPGAWTFLAANGLAVWDTMSVHAVVTPEAVREVREKMLPSRNLLSPADFGPLFMPRHEFLYGLAEATGRRTDRMTRPFKSAAEAVAAFKRGELDVGDEVEVP
jgi:hypothetical protein